MNKKIYKVDIESIKQINVGEKYENENYFEARNKAAIDYISDNEEFIKKLQLLNIKDKKMFVEIENKYYQIIELNLNKYSLSQKCKFCSIRKYCYKELELCVMPHDFDSKLAKYYLEEKELFEIEFGGN